MIKQFGRNILMALTIVAGATAAPGLAMSGAQAAPRLASPIALAGSAPVVQTVQYREDWRYREWRRREAYERFRHREARREWRHYERHPQRYGYNRHGGW